MIWGKSTANRALEEDGKENGASQKMRGSPEELKGGPFPKVTAKTTSDTAATLGSERGTASEVPRKGEEERCRKIGLFEAGKVGKKGKKDLCTHKKARQRLHRSSRGSPKKRRDNSKRESK